MSNPRLGKHNQETPGSVLPLLLTASNTIKTFYWQYSCLSKHEPYSLFHKSHWFNHIPMALASVYVQSPKRIPVFFAKIRDGQAPEHFTQQLLKDWGFSSTNDRAFIPLLKALGFLSSDGKPTQIYHDYRDHSKSKQILALALREAFSDIFLIKEHPTNSDRASIEGKFKSYHNVSDNVATLMAGTFLGLVAHADLSAPPLPDAPDKQIDDDTKTTEIHANKRANRAVATGLHYNIQIHLPSTKEVEVYNAIFKSLREHLLDE